jgi:hypothetical protein
MSNFISFEDPRLGQEIEGHLRRIVAAVRSHMEPKAIILRGSFGRGEGSVLVRNGRLCFLSDYEIDVATFSPLHRSLFRKLTRQLTIEIGVPIGIRWVRPDYMKLSRIGPVPRGPVPVTISLYESRYGSRILYGEDVIQSSPEADPAKILAESGLVLMVNRMAESLFYMTLPGPSESDNLTAYYWINKTILACAESLLVLWKSYHYSYKERGRRFAALARERLGFMAGSRDALIQWVTRATEFKLVPREDIYPERPHDTWLNVITVMEPVFRHLVEEILEIHFRGYEEFPECYLGRVSIDVRRLARSELWLRKLLDVYKSARAGRIHRGLLRPIGAAHIVYAVVPLVFLAYSAEQKSPLLREVRRQLRWLDHLDSPAEDPEAEWDTLRRRTAQNWKIFCY